MRFVPNTWMDNLADEVLKDPFFRKNNVPAVMIFANKKMAIFWILNSLDLKRKKSKWNWKTVI